MARRKKTKDYELRDEVVLRHLALYNRSFYEITDRLLRPSVKQSTSTIGRLVHDGLIERHQRSIPGDKRKRSGGKRTTFSLTPRGATQLGLHESRGRPATGTAAIDQDIGILCYCFLEAFRRHRVERPELIECFGQLDSPHANTPHVITEEDEYGHPVLFRVYQPTASLDVAIEQTRVHINKAYGNATIAPWVRDRDYGFLLLVDPKDIREYRTEVAGTELPAHARVVVGVGPSAASLTQFLDRLAK